MGYSLVMFVVYMTFFHFGTNHNEKKLEGHLLVQVCKIHESNAKDKGS